MNPPLTLDKWARRGFAAMMLVVAALFGCVAQPQSPDEFKQVISGGSGRRETYTVSKPFATVVKGVKDRAEQGFNSSHESTLMSGNQMEHSVVIWRCRTSVDEGRAQLVIQKENRPKGIGAPMPDGGWFWFVADMERVSPEETRITTYGLSGIAAGKTSDVLDAIKQWAQGKDVPAPSLR
jgi:hypothetical protein